MSSLGLYWAFLGAGAGRKGKWREEEPLPCTLPHVQPLHSAQLFSGGSGEHWCHLPWAQGCMDEIGGRLLAIREKGNPIVSLPPTAAWCRERAVALWGCGAGWGAELAEPPCPRVCCGGLQGKEWGFPATSGGRGGGGGWGRRGSLGSLTDKGAEEGVILIIKGRGGGEARLEMRLYKRCMIWRAECLLMRAAPARSTPIKTRVGRQSGFVSVMLG